MFYLLLSSGYAKSRTSQPLIPCQPAGWRCIRSCEGTQTGQLTPADWRAIPYHRISCSEYNFWRNWPGGAYPCSGIVWASVSGWWTIALCMAWGFISLFCFSLLHCLPFHYNYYYFYKYYILFQLLNCFYLNPWVLPSFQLSSQPEKRWATGCMVLNCQLGLTHDKEQTGCSTMMQSKSFCPFLLFIILSCADYSLFNWLFGVANQMRTHKQVYRHIYIHKYLFEHSCLQQVNYTHMT